MAGVSHARRAMVTGSQTGAKGPGSQEVQCHEKKSTLHPAVSKEPVKSFTCMGMRGSGLQAGRVTLASCRG